MRPLRVELEGIGSFRERTVLDLDGVDLFVLSGPTGAGKTTLLIDAMTLALYGTVPRYDDRRLVAPIIAQGANEGRVQLTFGVGDRTFTATRVVRRTKQGATTKEARLEEITGGGSVLRAGSADEVSSGVAQLLGLSFDQFCRSVILPQGAFDRFLFAKPAERGELLIQLLDLGVHDEVGRRARARAERAKARAEAAERRLQGDLAGADPMALPPLVRRIGQLQDLVERCREGEQELTALTEQGAQLRAAADRAAAERDALAALHRPADVDALATATREAADALARAEQHRPRAADALEQAERARADLPDAAQLAAVPRAVTARDEAARAIPDAERAVTEARQRRAETDDRVEAASRTVAGARDALADAQRRELVHALTDGLHAGDDCPVCGTELTADPPIAADAATTAARQALVSAEEDERTARTRRDEASRAEAQATARLEAATARHREVEAEVAAALDTLGVGDIAGAERLRTRAEAAEEALRVARAEDRRAATTEREARAALEAARSREEVAWATLDRARDAVAALGPPSLDRRDLAAAWDTLLAWAERTRPHAVGRADEAAAAVEEAVTAWRTRRGALEQACRDLDVDLDGAGPLEAATTALGDARAHHDRLEDRLTQVRAVTEERDAAREQAGVAEHLGKLLRADGFERWLLARALGQLVDGASALLRDLSSGAYSLALDPTNQFLVIDHRAADEPRTVKSLSGGERFLASLALALALAEHVAHLAADGAARLESLFLDEGFGTLDPDTLDVVAAALEDLGARGRVVGIVTHVRDLAERLPVRFEIRKGPAGSTVRRIDAGTDDRPDAHVTGTDAVPAETVTDADDEVVA